MDKPKVRQFSEIHLCPFVSRKERLIYVGISVENIIAPSVSGRSFSHSQPLACRVSNMAAASAQVGEEPKPEIIKEKKEVKKSKSWGRRSTRNKKSISYRSGRSLKAVRVCV